MKVPKKIAPWSVTVADQPVLVFHRPEPERQKNHFLHTLCHIFYLKFYTRLKFAFDETLKWGRKDLRSEKWWDVSYATCLHHKRLSSTRRSNLICGFLKHHQVRGRRKSSQKLLKRIAFVWEGGVSTVFAKQASRKKVSCTSSRRLHVRRLYELCSARPCCIGARSSTERTLRRVHVHTADKSIQCLVKEGNPWYKDKQAVEESSEVWMILVTV